MLTDEQIAAIRARCEAATPGEWVQTPTDGWDVFSEGGKWYLAQCRSPEDAAFIAAARQDVPALLAEVERLRAENAALREMVDDVRAILAFSVDEATAEQIGRAAHDALTRLARDDGAVEGRIQQQALTIAAMREIVQAVAELTDYDLLPYNGIVLPHTGGRQKMTFSHRVEPIRDQARALLARSDGGADIGETPDAEGGEHHVS